MSSPPPACLLLWIAAFALFTVLQALGISPHQ